MIKNKVVGLISECGAKENADMAYPNSRYSYDKTEEFSCDAWAPYDTEYLKQLRVDYKRKELVRDCKNDFEKVQEFTFFRTGEVKKKHLHIIRFLPSCYAG